MTEKRYDTIWDFCDWLGYQGIAYETLYYGSNKDIDNLIKKYLNDKKWFKINQLLDKQDKIIKDKESLIKAQNQQLDDVKRILIKYQEYDYDLIESILNELGWEQE